MESKKKIRLTPEQETLLIPLYCKALKDNLVLFDEKAREILRQIDYDFSQLRIPSKTCLMMGLRARQFDAYTQEFLANYPRSIVIHLGCGLDNRHNRVNHEKAEWYDLDMPQVIELKKQFYKETANYHLIASSVTELEWINGIRAENRPVLVIAEGLFMYLPEVEVKALITALKQAFPGSRLIFDAFSALTARRVKEHPAIQKTGARVQWGINDPKQIEQWIPGIHLQEERYFSQFEGLRRLKWTDRLLFHLTGLIPAARQAHRILYYSL